MHALEADMQVECLADFLGDSVLEQLFGSNTPEHNMPSNRIVNSFDDPEGDCFFPSDNESSD